MIDFLSSGLLSVIAFITVMSFIVVFHELGHYWAGRQFGVHAEAFSIGFGPELFGWKDRLGTRWKVSALPLGGFVRFRGDENAASAPDFEALEHLRQARNDADTVFHFKPLWQRSIIVAAGPIANFILAIILFGLIGSLVGEQRLEPRVGEIVEGAPAEQAGFESGDLILTMAGRGIDDFRDIQQYVVTRAGQPVLFEVERNGEQVRVEVIPEPRVRPDGLGGERTLGFVGIALSEDAVIERMTIPVHLAPVYGVQRTWETVTMIGDYMFRLVTGRASFEHVNGPLGIATTAGQLANSAVDGPADVEVALSDRLIALILSMLALSALLSVALGVMNLLPIPMLDGGHLAFYAYEAVLGRPASPAVQETGFRIGLGAILCMLVVATWNDLSYLRGLFS